MRSRKCWRARASGLTRLSSVSWRAVCLSRRNEILESLASLPSAPLVGHFDVLDFVENQRIMGRGIGWVDAHLLASASRADLPLWSLDKRLSAVARNLGISAAR